jgi:hypothetical protein
MLAGSWQFTLTIEAGKWRSLCCVTHGEKRPGCRLRGTPGSPMKRVDRSLEPYFEHLKKLWLRNW